MSLSGKALELPALVNLNVGGEMYTTSLFTLSRYPNSMLGSMFSGKFQISTDKSGNFFIDRDGALFRYIINYLRTGKLCLPTSFDEFEQLKAESEFFQIPGFEEAVESLHCEYLEHRNGNSDILEMEYSKEKYSYVTKSNGYIRLSSTVETLKGLFPDDGKKMKGQLYTGHSYKFNYEGIELVGANLHLPCYNKFNAIMKYITNNGFHLTSTAFNAGKDAEVGSIATYILVRKSARKTL